MDADSCPVKKEIVEISGGFNIKVIFVASYNHLQNETGAFEWHYVDTHKEAADLFIINHVQSGDVVVTQDIGLASILLSKNAFVLNPRGEVFEENGIQSALHRRYLAQKARRQGRFEKGPRAYSNEDRKTFCENFTRILSKIEGYE